MIKILVSACILGHPVRYNGSANTIEHKLLARWHEEGRIVPLCPEIAAGFPTPRAPAEIEPGMSGDDVLAGISLVFEDNGTDVTKQFVLGARLALETAQENNCKFALLTDGSPSCGTTYQYSGSFDGKTREAMGVVASLLASNGIAVFAEHQIEELNQAVCGHRS